MLLPYADSQYAQQKALWPWISQFIWEILFYNIAVIFFVTININEILFDTYSTNG